jgi:hypothetical protein
MDVADACGISSVHANRVIQELRHVGLLEWDSKRVKIHDWDALARLGDFNDDYLQYRAATAKEAPLPGISIPEWT